MKLPDLHDTELAGVHFWRGDAHALATTTAAAKLKMRAADLSGVASKAELLGVLAKGLGLPEHFGSNWDALADSIEDEDWFGRSGCVVTITHSGPYRKSHAADWATVEDIFAEAADYWRERHKPFWVFVD